MFDAAGVLRGYSHDDIMQGDWSVFAIRQGDAEESLAFESLIRDGRFGPVEMSLRRRDGPREEHCSTIQGFLIARPMPATDAFALASSMLAASRLHGRPG